MEFNSNYKLIKEKKLCSALKDTNLINISIIQIRVINQILIKVFNFRYSQYPS
jgi:hypothetical protein